MWWATEEETQVLFYYIDNICKTKNSCQIKEIIQKPLLSFNSFLFDEDHLWFDTEPNMHYVENSRFCFRGRTEWQSHYCCCFEKSHIGQLIQYQSKGHKRHKTIQFNLLIKMKCTMYYTTHDSSKHTFFFLFSLLCKNCCIKIKLKYNSLWLWNGNLW